MTTPPSPPRRRRRRGSGPLVAAAALLAGAVGAGGTVALWNVDGSTPLGTITAGTLDIELLDETVWRDTSQGVHGAPLDIDPATFLARPGDTVVMSQQFTTELEGDNMLGRITVDWDEGGPTLPEGTSARYTVRDDFGAVLVENDLGERGLIQTLHADDARTAVLSLEVTISFDESMADRFGDGAPQTVNLGTVVIDLDQVRDGEGFTS